jgi:hypothetical protein
MKGVNYARLYMLLNNIQEVDFYHTNCNNGILFVV